MIYHLIPEGEGISEQEMARKSGLDITAVSASLDRLNRSFLIERDEKVIRLLSVGEALIKCQVKYDQNLPFVIENGVIKERKK